MKTLRSLAAVGAMAWAIPALGQVNLNVNVQASNGSNTIGPVTANTVVNYQVIGTLTPDAGHLGLALYGFDLEFEGGPLAKANSFLDAPAPSGPPAVAACTNVMRSFQKNLGITNPEGVGGTVIAGKLVQIGGGANTIKNTADNAEFPVGSVITGVARGVAANNSLVDPKCGPATLITGSLTAPSCPQGVQQCSFKLKASQVFANVIDAGQSGAEEFWATKAAGVGTLTDLTVVVAGDVPPPSKTMTAALPAATAGTGVNANTIRVMSRTTRNETRVDFDGNLPGAPPAGAIIIRELQTAGAFGSDIAANFAASIADTPGGAVDTARLILKDNGSNLQHKKWYQIESTAAWTGVTPFCLQFLVMAGDCSGDGNVNAADLTCINTSIPTVGAPATTDALFRKDILAGATGGINTADLSAANGQLGSLLIQAAKPTGHTTCP